MTAIDTINTHLTRGLQALALANAGAEKNELTSSLEQIQDALDGIYSEAEAAGLTPVAAKTVVATKAATENLLADLKNGKDFSGYAQFEFNLAIAGVIQALPSSARETGLVLFKQSTSGLDLRLQRMLDNAATLQTSSVDDDTKGAVLRGDGGNDKLVGGAGNDRLFGDDGDDLLIGGAGNDTLSGGDGNDVLFGGAGNDDLYGGGGDDYIDGGDGNDTITDNSGRNVLKGGAGNDVIIGSGIMEGGTGDDLLKAARETSDDTYIFNLGDGKDTIVEMASSSKDSINDVLQFGAGINAASVMRIRRGSDLVLKISETDQVTIQDWFATSRAQIETIQFADGSKWTSAAIANMPILIPGTDKDDQLIGGDEIDRIDGGAGSDFLFGGGGDDQLYGGTGDDLLDGADGNDQLYGGEGDDDLYGGAGDDFLDGGDGDDYIFDNSGRNILKGGAGNDTIIGSGTMEGGTGNDTLKAGDGASDDTYIFNLGDGKDTIVEMAYSNRHSLGDVLQFGEGINAASVKRIRNGQDLILKISETDQVTIQEWFASSNVQIETIQFADGTKWTPAALQKMETLMLGTDKDDKLTGGDEVNRIEGGAGNDVLNGGGGDDLLFGGAGNDKLSGGEGNDFVDGGDGDDVITDSQGRNILKGGAGNDTIIGSGTMEGGTGNDTLKAGDGASDDTYIFNLGDGKDTIVEMAHSNRHSLHDVLQFGEGINAASVKRIRNGQDLILKISETDQVTIQEWFASSNVQIETIQFADGTKWTPAALQKMETLMLGTDKDDKLTGGDEVNRIEGGAGNDVLNGGGGDDLLFGGAGNDKLFGGEGNDFVDGGDGDDVITDSQGRNILKGGAGNDTIIGSGTMEGGTGNDTLKAGDGASDDTYIFNLGDGKDTIVEMASSSFVSNNDVLQFGEGINSNQLWFKKVGRDLDVTRVGTTEGVVIKDWYASRNTHIEQFKTADGKTLLDSQVDTLVQAMAAFAPPAAGQTTLPANYQAQLGQVLAANWK